MRFADVIIPLNLPQVLTYGIPEQLQGTLQPGMRVEVSLGRNKQYAGIIDKLHDRAPELYSVKPIKNVLDEHPVVNEIQLTFWRWIGQYYIAAPGEVMQAALPAHLKLMAETSLVWCGELDVLYEWSEAASEAVFALEQRKEITLSDLRGIVGLRFFAQVLNELIEKQAVLINDSLESTYSIKKEKIVTLTPAYQEEAAIIKLFNELERAPKQLQLLMAYTELSIKNGFVRRQDLMERTGSTAAQVKALAEKGIFVLEDRQADRLLYTGKQQNIDILFTPAQAEAYTKLQQGLEEKNVALLHGVTGSGKTLLYIQKIKECLATGKQAVFLLPEIALTTQLVSRLMAHFGEEMGVYHSHFSNNERVEIWEKVRKGDYKLVLGPRSALWLPYSDIGLIIADEEHDGSYKQKDPAPRFHARDAAIYLAGLHGAKVILGSATPSVESLYNVQHNKYAYVPLKERYLGVKMPVIELVNAQPAAGVPYGGQMITPPLQQAIIEALQNRRQVILFQNRRGYAPFQICTVCGWVPQCKNCAVSLTYHKSTDKMHCHYCGMKASVIHTCPSCGSNRLTSKSFGTEKIEEEVKQIFPEARVARMDVDSMRGKKSMTDLLTKLDARKIDILVGTQMVVKGLDFAGVSLVGILNADNLLSFPDFRVNERAFQLMEQVSGRAGRTDGAGRVLIQAYNLKHPVLEWVQAHDVHTFYSNEIQYRQYFGYPPFSRLIKITFKHADEQKATIGAELMAKALTTLDGLTVQGPGPAIVPRVRNMYIMEIWIKCPRDGKLLDNVKAFLKEQKQIITGTRGLNSLQVLFDVDPV
ncbi:MAG: primosomal protein N' [Flavipsychrobacter sp.]|nr:primosomal protein N' [Flavipsychrobacter sp.]